MASLANVYQCIDDSGTTAGPSGGQAGGASSFPVTPPFTALTIANAVQVAFIISSALQRPVRLVSFGGTPPWTLVVGIGANTAITSCPSGVGY